MRLFANKPHQNTPALKVRINKIDTILGRIRRPRYLGLSIFILILYLSPFYISGEESRVLVHDCLDSEIVWIKILAESGQIFGSLDSTIPNIMNGLPRNCIGSEFNILLLWYFLFDPYIAYVINLSLIHFLAFAGMYILLKHHSLCGHVYEPIRAGVALCFSLLPFAPSVGLTVASLPIILYSFLNFRSRTLRISDWVIILFIPFYSSFARCYVFFLFAMVMILAYDSARLKRINLRFLMAIASMTLIFLVVEYRLLYDTFLNEDFISHRVEFYPIYIAHNILEVIDLAAYNFIYGQEHVPSLHSYFIGLSIAIAFFALLREVIHNQNLVAFKENIILIRVMLIIGVISLFYGFWYWEEIVPLRQQIDLLSSFNFTRFHWLHPMLWYIAFALSLNIIIKYIKYERKIIFILLILQIGFLFSYHNPVVQSGGFGQVFDDGLSYREFFSEELFQNIADYIGTPQSDYRVICLGFHPSIAQYNGFYTLDSYQSNYPLEYKHEFRQIIEKELDKNDEMRVYFDNWGSRCYVFVDDIYGMGYLINKNDNICIQNIDLNITALNHMNASYIISSVEICNFERNNLNLLYIFENDASPWRLWLYEIG